jgi:hypothetical protein
MSILRAFFISPLCSRSSAEGFLDLEPLKSEGIVRSFILKNAAQFPSEITCFPCSSVLQDVVIHQCLQFFS